MPFPWKKNRVTRISQIVADLQSPKRGASLVVQTGFPTSLIDLFVKNRSRFKKHRSIKPLHHDIPDPPPPSPATTPPPSLSEVPLPSPELEPNADGAAVPVRVGECGSGSGFNLVIVKILMVVVLLASVKRVTVGITVSAFALLFIEYAVKRVVSSSNLKSFFQRVSDCAWLQKLLLVVRLKQKKEAFEVGEGELGYDSLGINEIEVVEAKSEVGVCGELDSLSDDVAWGCSRMLEDDESSCHYEASECKIRGTRSGRFKAKMVKKLVPKKFRGSKKEKKEKGVSKQTEDESCSEVSSVVEEDKLHILEIEEEVEEDVGKEEAKVGCMKDDEVDGGITCSHEKRRNRVGNSGSMILVIIALAGLLVGRFQALLLSMAWCCLQKMVTSLWRSHNVPSIKGCSVQNS